MQQPNNKAIDAALDLLENQANPYLIYFKKMDY